MAELCAGLAAAIASGAADPAAVAGLLPPHSLIELLRMWPSADAEGTILGIAIALPYLPGAQEVRSRCILLTMFTKCRETSERHGNDCSSRPLRLVQMRKQLHHVVVTRAKSDLLTSPKKSSTEHSSTTVTHTVCC